MRALSMLIALHACLSRGEQWTRYPEIYPKFDYNNLHNTVEYNWGQDYSPYKTENLHGGVLSPFFIPPNLIPKSYTNLNGQVTANTLHSTQNSNGNQYLEAKAKQNEDLNLFTKPVYENQSQREHLNHNGVQNSLSFHSRHTLGDGVDAKQDVKKVNNYVYILNKTNSIPQSQHTYTSTVTASVPNSANLLAGRSGTRYWVNENNENYKESRWINPHPLWNQPPTPSPTNPVDVFPAPDGFYPDNNNNNDLDQLNQKECYNLNDIVRDLRIILHKSSIGEEKHNLKKLFKILRVFIMNNNLQYAPFGTVVHEVGKALLRGNNDHDSLREDEIVQILQEFRNQDLKNFLLEISSHPELNLQDVVIKLVELLYRLKQVLIQRNYSQESIRLVISRAVQWSVPLVGYYFEKECKIKTQQYIVQNLETALNLKLESVQHVVNVNELQNESNFGNLGNVGGLEKLGNSENFGNLEGLGNILNPGEQGNVGGLGLGNLGGSRNVDVFGNQGYVGGLGGMGNQRSLGILGGIEKQIYPGGLEGLGKVIIPLKQGT